MNEAIARIESKSVRHRRPRFVRDGVPVGTTGGLTSSLRQNASILVAIALLIISLCYKMTPVGILVLAGLGYAIVRYWRQFDRLDIVFVLALAYVADTTLTAFLVSVPAGMTRMPQFCIVAIGLIGLYVYAQGLKRQEVELVAKAVGVVCIAILAHVIIWHVKQGHVMTWKYLSDTKFVFSLSIVPLFALEDTIKKRSQILWLGLLVTMFAILLMSGERKALLLFIAIFGASRTSWRGKIYIAGLLGVVLGFLLLVQDNGYIYRQLSSVSDDYSKTPMRYFFSVQGIADDSDVIRAFVNRNAWHLFLEHPWLGLGSNGYLDWALKTYGYGTGLSMNVHGEMYRVPAEGGLLGIAIALSFLGVAAWRIYTFLVERGGLDSPSLDRGALYVFLYLLCFFYSEALDTGMLMIIGALGIVAGSLPRASQRLRLRRADRLKRLWNDGSTADSSDSTGARIGNRRFARIASRRRRI